MNSKVQSLKAFLGQAGRVALVEVAATKGSTPREAGAFMLVSASAIFGTIGGGQLEYMAIDKARQMLGSGTRSRSSANETRIEVDEVCATLDVPLGPEIGQCCGGRVEVSIRLVDGTIEEKLIADAESEEAHLPHVYLFGGGHVGQALAASLALLPIHVVVVETRSDALEDMPETVETRLTPMPEAVVREAPAGSAFAILTHDHALDFLIVAEALKRDDTAYVGMIGSKTKKATFRSWFLKSAEGNEAQFDRLVSPVGGNTVKDKRPPVIAALAAAEIMTALVSHAVGAPGPAGAEKAMAG
ncbi:xanthine dehydrogenase accessory protein XdhC [Mesorhizobium sp. M2C.T.Ca.TU.002.02.1.1]|uniref:xanthine dehydrogenase accessory protein XdhC n=1 Tax=Mesorhizobium sp. M2C.T.Ca.TU.002.02.1.1 TaxID=2496788 RepID=UPI000FC9A00A|nr:xanthine dehydrogenase accessory protein XdhC [Mesorhizobium sp. M2C.T.Ca.TU.002.02.1.1]RUU57527.1 xanthine dehydrogenase accessory protein XdhC [Mesorhizobium sp. M2C.T.Ca.TU.009.01.2.1]RUU58474.1 xanthine dehydrogenase accessory protein XdhC [Mesorhizobium sp. M2C.T.Ca.TU.002.02.1.1]